jgi:dTDP-4-amino-4,6-dideoxygalactose transaminase
METLKQIGIQTSFHYPPVHHFHIYHDEWKKRGGTLPLTEDAGKREVTLPLFQTMTESQVMTVVEAIRLALQENDC